MICLGDLTLEETKKFFADLGEKPYRGVQLFEWINQKGVSSFDEMTNLPKMLREKLKQNYSIFRLTFSEKIVNDDGTTKLIFLTKEGEPIESVIIPMDKGRNTICLSSQVGCSLGCKFCLTGMLRLTRRNLSVGEILDQVRFALKISDVRITNIVFMGMGEPLLNFDNVVSAISVLKSEHGMNFSKRRITVSTAGIVPKIPELGEKTGVNLAVSLNAPDDELRNFLMPINRKYPLKKLVESLKSYPLPKRQRITIEYVLIKGVNDSLSHAQKLAELLKGLRVKINLIPMNPHEFSKFLPPDKDVIEDFMNVLYEKHYTVTVRKSRGAQIKAACGQLGNKPEYVDLFPVLGD